MTAAHGPAGNELSSADVLADRLEWMRDRQGCDPQTMLDRQVALHQMTRGQADRVRAILRQRQA